MLAIAKNPPNPNAAKVFVNWVLSKEGQMAWPQPERDTSCSRRVDLQQWCMETWRQSGTDGFWSGLVSCDLLQNLPG